MRSSICLLAGSPCHMLLTVVFAGACAPAQPALGVWGVSVPAEGCWPPQREHPCETRSEQPSESVIVISFGMLFPGTYFSMLTAPTGTFHTKLTHRGTLAHLQLEIVSPFLICPESYVIGKGILYLLFIGQVGWSSKHQGLVKGVPPCPWQWGWNSI